MLEEKVLLMGMKFTKKDYPRLYGTFYAIGVNTVVWVDGEDKIEIDLTDIAKQADMSKIEPAKRPLLNPTLELSGIYFMQELRRPVGQKLRIAKVPFAKLPELLIDKAMAYAVNPLGFNLVLNREQLNKIIGLK